MNVYRAQELIPRNRFRQAGTTKRVVVPACQAGNRFLGSLKGLQRRAQGSGYQWYRKVVCGYRLQAIKIVPYPGCTVRTSCKAQHVPT